MQFYWVRGRVRQGKVLVYWMDEEHNTADYFTKKHPTAIIGHIGANILSPKRAKVSMHATCHLMTCNGVLNTSLPRETDDRRTKSPYYLGRKQKTDGRRQTYLIGKQGIGGDNIVLKWKPLIWC